MKATKEGDEYQKIWYSSPGDKPLIAGDELKATN